MYGDPKAWKVFVVFTKGWGRIPDANAGYLSNRLFYLISVPSDNAIKLVVRCHLLCVLLHNT